MTRATALYFLLTLFLCSWHLDDGHNDNTMARAASVASLVDRGTLEITPIHHVTGDKSVVNGRYYSDKAPLPTFVVLPFHWLAVHLGLVIPDQHGTLTDGLLRLGGFLCGSLPLALLITLAWRDLVARERPLPVNAGLLAALPLFGSFCYVYSGSFYNHLPGALFAVLAARALQRERSLLAGLYGGAAFLCESALLFFVGLWGLQLLAERRWRPVLLLTCGLIPALLAAAAHNLAVTGDPLVFPNAYAANYAAMHQQYGFGTWQPEAILGLLISDYRGLFFYMPFLLIGLWTWTRGHTFRAFLRDPFVLPSLLFLALFMTHATWWGGWTYGPRYLMAGAVLLTFAALHRIPHRPLERWGTIALCGFGLLCALAAKSTVTYSLPTGVLHPLFTEIGPHVRNGDWNADQWPVLLGLSPGFATLAFLPVFATGLYLLARISNTLPRHAPLP